MDHQEKTVFDKLGESEASVFRTIKNEILKSKSSLHADPMIIIDDISNNDLITICFMWSGSVQFSVLTDFKGIFETVRGRIKDIRIQGDKDDDNALTSLLFIDVIREEKVGMLQSLKLPSVNVVASSSTRNINSKRRKRSGSMVASK